MGSTGLGLKILVTECGDYDASGPKHSDEASTGQPKAVVSAQA
ncbi:hypothetical protein THF1C08_30390 [Vibrio jasicida]|uniref:Uncharacterized protein n=1 Tax=Vibrio jasicida TaxID=766224 RepID=A0AAU9QS61_9VIBR|nr:hypothetical protein THF1C08_30390 [Vibrio jasicida]CAH1599174.1 hypothetical protein THF1A12_40045 [Vibrio jasicida]